MSFQDAHSTPNGPVPGGGASRGSDPQGLDSQGLADDGLARLTADCVRFQLDLSCLVDGELDEKASARAITHLEECPECGNFFGDVRKQVRAHRSLTQDDVTEAGGLVEQYTALVGAAPQGDVETIELVHRLASIFYQLGKAYICTGQDDEYREKLLGHQYVYERAVHVSSTKNKGRGFVDGVLQRGQGDTDRGGVDWTNARHMLNGQLESIRSPLEKGRRLLAEALQADPSFEEPRLYLAFLDGKEGKHLKAARGFRQVFDTGVDEANRAHAAVQLGLLYEDEEEFKKAIAFNRWVLISGVERRDPRFFFVHFNIGKYYAHLGMRERSLASFRRMLDRHPDRIEDAVALFRRAPLLQEAIDLQPGFGERLVQVCPELFGESAGDPGAAETFASDPLGEQDRNEQDRKRPGDSNPGSDDRQV